MFKQDELIGLKKNYKLFSLPELDNRGNGRGGREDEKTDREEVVLTFCALV